MPEPGQVWSSDFKLLLAMTSYSTGLTIPRISSPRLLRTQIGVFLLFPIQLIVLFFITVPCLFLELALGQYSSRAVIRIWDMCPLLRGIGLCSFLTFLLYQIYYSFLCTCTLCFTCLSVIGESQWKSCNRTWARVNCFTLEDNYTRRFECNERLSKEKCDEMNWQTSIEQFYFNRVLNVEYVGTPQNELFMYAFMTGLIVFLANYKGPQASEKILLILAIIPTFQLFVLLLVPLLNSNGLVILNHLFSKTDNWNLIDPNTWSNVVKLSLSSSGVGFGVYTTLGTHCSFRKPLHFKAIITSFASLLSTTIFNIILQNYLVWVCVQNKLLMDDLWSFETNLPLPDAVFFLKNSSSFWTIMWLSNSYLLGLRTLIVMMTINAEIFYNSVPQARKRHVFFILFFCVLINTSGVFFSTKIGYQVAKTIEKIIHDFSIVFLNMLQLIGVVYFYGIANFRDDIHFMLGLKPSRFWVLVYILNPIFLGAVLIYTVHKFYEELVTFSWIYFLENALLWFSLFMMLLYALFYTVTATSNKDLKILSPENDWGPRETHLVRSRKMFVAYNMAKEYLYRQERLKKHEL